VPPDHPDSNFRMANEALLSKVAAKPEQVWRMAGENPNVAEAASDYERRLHESFGIPAGQLPRFDLVLLGMGPDGHTASLFPGSPNLPSALNTSAAAGCVGMWSPVPPQPRLSLNLSAIPRHSTANWPVSAISTLSPGESVFTIAASHAPVPDDG